MSTKVLRRSWLPTLIVVLAPFFTEPCSAVTTTFYFTGGPQYYTVPAGVTSVVVFLKGASGAHIGSHTGGLGAYMRVTLGTVPGETLTVYVGGQGNRPAGGYNGGGNGGPFGGGGGGGASRVTATGRNLVAGGGGGASGSNFGTGSNGGAGGNYNAGYGLITGGFSALYCGNGGTSAGGGAGAIGGGQAGYGYNGGAASQVAGDTGGGGGGGYWGGGGGRGTNLSPGSGGGGGGSSYSVIPGTVYGAFHNGNGEVSISYVDSTPPNVSSITRSGSNPTNATYVNFTVVFDEPVTGVDASDFTIDSPAKQVTGAFVYNVVGSNDIYYVVVDTGSGDGLLSIDVSDDDTILDPSGNRLGGTGAGNGDFTAGEAYTIDKSPPGVSIGAPSTTDTSGGPVTYTVTYTGASAVTLANGDVTLNKTGTDGTVDVSGSGTSSRTVTISSITGDGTLGISLAAGTATDAVGNTALAAGPSTTFNIDNTAPAVAVNTLTTSDSRPALTGTINDAAASISVTVDGQTNGATNNGTTWSLADNTLTTLAVGTYNVQVTATDGVGNTGYDGTSSELVIESGGVGTGGGTVTCNLTPAQIVEGARLELTAPAGGSDYRWKKDGGLLVNGGTISGATTQVLVIDPLALVNDSGTYSCQYEDGIAKAIVETDGFGVTVLAPAGMLTLALWNLLGLIFLTALIGVSVIRKEQRPA